MSRRRVACRARSLAIFPIRRANVGTPRFSFSSRAHVCVSARDHAQSRAQPGNFPRVRPHLRRERREIGSFSFSRVSLSFSLPLPLSLSLFRLFFPPPPHCDWETRRRRAALPQLNTIKSPRDDLSRAERVHTRRDAATIYEPLRAVARWNYRGVP